jgi:hypothetical protein
MKIAPRFYAPKEAIMGSPQATITAAAGDATATLTVSEPGILSLRRMVVSVSQDGALANAPMNALVSASVVALEIDGSIALLRGRNTPAGPAGWFAPTRPDHFVELPDIHVNAGQTVALTLNAANLVGLDGDFSFGCPFFPDRYRGTAPYVIPKGGTQVAMASPTAAVADNTDVPLTMTIDTPGLLDLSKLWLGATIDVTANVDAQDGARADLWGYITQLTLPSGENIVLGQGTVLASSGLVSQNRQINFVKLPVVKVVPGETIVLGFQQDSGVAGDARFGAPLYPTAGGRGGVNVGPGGC